MYKSDYSCIFEKWFSFNVKHLKTIRFFPHIQALLRSILSMYKLVNVWVTWDRQVLAFPLNAADLWAQLCCPAISKLLFFFECNQSHRFGCCTNGEQYWSWAFLGHVGRGAFSFPAFLSWFTSSNGAGCVCLAPAQAQDVLGTGTALSLLWGWKSPGRCLSERPELVDLIQGAVCSLQTCRFAVKPQEW